MMVPWYELKLNLRFDIVLKTVYAFFWMNRNGSVPIFVQNMYAQHIQVWNHFFEAKPRKVGELQFLNSFSGIVYGGSF
jgi:hypothetical protein